MFRDNWLRFGFGPDLVPFSQGLPFTIDYSIASAHPTLRQPLDIAMAACWHIYEMCPKPLTLMLSGGVDSQAMAYAFFKSGVPARYAMMRYNDGLNDHDLCTPFYEDHGIPVEVFDFDVLRFHAEELFDWAERFQNNSPHLLTHCKIASLLYGSGTVVSSGNIITRQDVGSMMNYSIFGLERFARISRASVVPFFFSYCPHLVHATRDLTTDPRDKYKAKVTVYQECGFPVKPQEQKQHGFERVKDHFDSYEVDSKTRLRYLSQPSSRPYDLLFRYPLMEKIRYSKVGLMRF